MVQGPTNTVHSGRPGVPHSHLRVGFRDFLTQHWVSSLSLSVSVWTQQLRELLQLNQLNQLATYKSLPPHPTHWKSRSVIPKKKTQSPLASSWSVNQPELCSELCSEDCLTAACLALHLLRASLRGLPDGSLLGTTAELCSEHCQSVRVPMVAGWLAPLACPVWHFPSSLSLSLPNPPTNLKSRSISQKKIFPNSLPPTAVLAWLVLSQDPRDRLHSQSRSIPTKRQKLSKLHHSHNHSLG